MNTVKKRASNYAQISNEFLRDKNISFKAKGLFSYMFSMDDNWNFTIRSISIQQGEGETSIRTALNELKNFGFIKYVKHTNGKGTYFLDDVPNVENPNVENPIMGKSTRIKKTNTIRIPIDKNTNNKTTNKQSNYQLFIDHLKNNVSIPSKVTSTKQGKDLFNNIVNKKQLCIDYINHQEDKAEFSKRITAFMEDYRINKKVEVDNKDISKMRFSSLETFNNFNIINDYKYKLLEDGYIKIKDLVC